MDLSTVEPEVRFNTVVQTAAIEMIEDTMKRAIKYYREFGAEDRFEGDVYTLNLALPFDPIVSKLEHVLSR